MSRYLVILAASLASYAIKTQSRPLGRMTTKISNAIGSTIASRRSSARRRLPATMMAAIASGAAAGFLVWGARRLLQGRRPSGQHAKLADQVRIESPYLKRTEDLPLDLDL
jgi:hypothetical protein